MDQDPKVWVVVAHNGMDYSDSCQANVRAFLTKKDANAHAVWCQNHVTEWKQEYPGTSFWDLPDDVETKYTDRLTALVGEEYQYSFSLSSDVKFSVVSIPLHQ